MIIKKFEGKTEEEAIEKAKAEMGSSAIVMNMKTIKPGGIMGLFKKPYVEVTAEHPVTATRLFHLQQYHQSNNRVRLLALP